MTRILALAALTLTPMLASAAVPVCEFDVARGLPVLKMSSGVVLELRAADLPRLLQSGECAPPAAPHDCRIASSSSSLAEIYGRSTRPLGGSPMTVARFTISIADSGRQLFGADSCYSIEYRRYGGEGNVRWIEVDNFRECSANPQAARDAFLNTMRATGFCAR